MNCLVCHDQIEQTQRFYCPAHARAYENLEQAFPKWATCYGTLTVRDFLKRIEKLPETGEKTREIARFLSEGPPRWA